MDSNKETFDTWNKVAKLYEDKFMKLDLYDNSYDIFCEQVNKENSTILEIGCGPGNITKYLLKKRPDYKMEGIDISPNMIALAKINAPMADFKVMDCRDVYKIESQYNGIISGFCLPYLSAVESAKFIKDCAALLKNNAVLYFSFVEGEYKKSGFQTASTGDRVYFYFHPLDSLTEALKDNNFEIIKTINTHYQKSSETEEMHTIIIAKKIK